MPLILAAAALCIAYVHDGDTIRLCDGEKVRLANIDAPELAGSSQCNAQSRQRLARSDNPAWCDNQLGIRSRDALRAFVARGQAVVHRSATDRYGRTLASLTVNGQDAGEYLISRGLARRWR